MYMHVAAINLMFKTRATTLMAWDVLNDKYYMFARTSHLYRTHLLLVYNMKLEFNLQFNLKITPKKIHILKLENFTAVDETNLISYYMYFQFIFLF